MKHPAQPIVTDKDNVLRYKENKIVRYLLDEGGIDLNQIAIKNFDNEDREQLAQLIGYSVDGFASLSYASKDTVDYVDESIENDISLKDAELELLRGRLDSVRSTLKPLIKELFKIHEDDIVS